MEQHNDRGQGESGRLLVSMTASMTARFSSEPGGWGRRVLCLVAHAALLVGRLLRRPSYCWLRRHNVGMSERGDLRAASYAFIAAAFETLSAEHVIPTSVAHRYIAVGHDYFGDSIRGLPEYQTLEALLDDAYPERFAEPLKRQNSEFASTYMFDFLEACVARCSRDGRFDSESPAVDESIDELLSVLGTSSYEVVCCRHVSHLTTISGDEVQIGDVTVVPEQTNSGVYHELIGRIVDEVPGAAGPLNRVPAGGGDVPRCPRPSRSQNHSASSWRCSPRRRAACSCIGA
jgi:hypothetical protein